LPTPVYGFLNSHTSPFQKMDAVTGFGCRDNSRKGSFHAYSEKFQVSWRYIYNIINKERVGSFYRIFNFMDVQIYVSIQKERTNSF
jgi:hypothetical protein